MKDIIFSGIKPSGKLHLGNYIGAIKQWVRLANENTESTNIFCIVDMHAITVQQDPTELYENSLQVAAWYIAAGLNPEKNIIFIQSQNPDHANLGWILNCFTSMGEMNRMTQYKEKSDGKEFVSVGLFDYPALMAADILLYNTTEVPVGEDQKQHVELTRDIAQRFNSRYGDTLVLPTPVIPQFGARIKSLSDPTKKMSKSETDPNGTIDLLDSAEIIRKKLKSATTDSGSEIKYDQENKPGIANLLDIYSNISGKTIKEIENEEKETKYGQFKEKVAEVIVGEIVPLQEKYLTLVNSPELKTILKDNAQRAYEMSHKKIDEVYSLLW